MKQLWLLGALLCACAVALVCLIFADRVSAEIRRGHDRATTPQAYSITVGRYDVFGVHDVRTSARKMRCHETPSAYVCMGGGATLIVRGIGTRLRVITGGAPGQEIRFRYEVGRLGDYM